MYGMSALLRNARCVSNIVGSVIAKQGGYTVAARTAAFKSDLKIKWIRPPTIRSWRPEKSGDGGLDLKITPQVYCHHFEGSKELETKKTVTFKMPSRHNADMCVDTKGCLYSSSQVRSFTLRLRSSMASWNCIRSFGADEIVKRMFTLEFARRKETHYRKREATMALVQRHRTDRGSMESRLASMTSKILDLQEHMLHNPGDKRAKVFLDKLIAKRKKFLTHLRRWDYKRFEWILEKLNLIYKPYPIVCRNVTRKGSLRRLTRLHCQKLKRDKMQAYRLELQAQKKKFFLEKVEKLQFIRDEEIACEKEPTVSESDIEAAKEVAASCNKTRGQ